MAIWAHTWTCERAGDPGRHQRSASSASAKYAADHSLQTWTDEVLARCFYGGGPRLRTEVLPKTWASRLSTLQWCQLRQEGTWVQPEPLFSVKKQDLEDLPLSRCKGSPAYLPQRGRLLWMCHRIPEACPDFCCLSGVQLLRVPRR